MNDFDTCPACGFTLNCSGCGEPIENIIAQSSLTRELAALRKEHDALVLERNKLETGIRDALKCDDGTSTSLVITIESMNAILQNTLENTK
jgi:hypothetical protein